MASSPFVVRLLTRLVGWSTWEFALGDIEEEFHRIRHTRPWYARVWLWRQALGLVLAMIVRRRPRPRSPAPARPLVDSLWRDLRMAIRSVRRAPLVALTVMITLATGIGATATMFSITHGILSDLPFEQPEDIVVITMTDLERDEQNLPVPPRHFLAWRDAQTTMRDIAALDRRTFHVRAAASSAQRYDGAALSPWTFRLLGVQPAIGRDFVAADADGEAGPTVVLSDFAWHELFQGDRDVLGRQVRVDDTLRTVIGVMPEGFGFPTLERLWVPLRVPEAAAATLDSPPLVVVGRLGPEATLVTANSEFAAVSRRVALDDPAAASTMTAAVRPYTHLFVGDDAPLLLYTMVIIVSFVLLIACANVTNALIARAATREREMAIRVAVGGNRGHLIQQQLAETLLLAVGGGVGGMLLTMAGVSWFNRALGFQIERFWIDIGVDFPVLGFTVLLTGLATIGAGLAPALQASRVDLAGAARPAVDGSSAFRVGRLSWWLVAAEVGLSCGLLAVSGIMIKGVVGLSQRDIGFEGTNLAAGTVDLGEFDYPDEASIDGFVDRATDRWRRAAGSELAVASGLPGRDIGRDPVAIGGVTYADDDEIPRAQIRAVTPRLLSTFDITAYHGRSIDTRDRRGTAPVAIVNRSFVELLLDGDEAIGRQIRVGGLESDRPWRRVVGVVDDRGMSIDDGRKAPGVFLPLAQTTARTLVLIAPETVAVGTTAGQLFAVVAEVDPFLPLYNVGSVHELLRDENAPQRTFAVLFGAFGIGALLLAAVGLYGVLAFAVTRHAREIAVRRALGARPAHVVYVAVRSTVVQLAVGIGAGLLLALAIGPAVGEFTFGAHPRDPMILTGVAAVLIAVAVIASLVPSLRALHIDPMALLRQD